MGEEDELISGMLTLKQVLRRERKLKLLVLAIALVLSLGLCWLAFAFDQSPTVLLLVLATIGFGASLAFLYHIVQQWNPQTHPVMWRLHDDPQSIVWVYAIKLDFIPFGLRFWKERTLSLRLDDGDELQLRARFHELEQIDKALQIKLPHATFGYTKEREQWYAANPLLLLNNDEDMNDQKSEGLT